MTTRLLSYRLKSEGKAELLRDQREIKDGFKATYDAAEQGANAASAATERLEGRWRKMAQAAQESAAAQATQARFNALLGVSPGADKSARDSAEVFRVMAETQAAAETRARLLKEALDPLGAATDRLNDELEEMVRLHRQGLISTAELAKGQAVARTRFDETAAAIARNEKGLTRLAMASRLNLGRQGADVFTTLAMGMNPAMVAIQQGPQVLDAFATSGIKLTGTMIAAASAIGLVGGATLAAIAAWNEGEAAAGRLESAATGMARASGLTAAQLGRVADANNEAGRVTVGTAEDMAAAYARLAGTTETEIGRMIAMTRDFAELTGVDAKDAVEAFTKAVGDPLKTATDLTRSSLGLFTQAELDNIEALQTSGDLLAARAALLDGLKGAIDNHVRDTGAIESAWDAVGNSIKGAWEWLGRYLYRDESERLQDVINRRASIERGQRENGRPLDARTQGLYDMLGRQGQEILNAREARRTASERAAANQRAQLEEARTPRRPGPRAATSSGSTASARSDVDTRQREADRIVEDLTRQEAAARRDRLERWLQGGPSPETRATLERELYQLDVAARDAALKVQEETLAKAGRLDEEARLALERIRAANAETDAAKDAEIATRERTEIEQSRRDAARRLLDREVQALSRTAELARMRGDAAGYATADRAARVAAYRRQIMDDPEFKGGAFAAQALAEARVSEELRAQAEGGLRAGLGDFIAEVRRGGLKAAFMDQLLDAGENLLNQFLARMSKVDWSKFLNGGSSQGGASDLIAKGLNFLFGRQNANGTDFWTGGPTWVGERGPELLDLPRGSRITEANRSLSMIRSAATGESGRVVAPSFTYAPSHTISGVDTARLEAILAQDREEFRTRVVDVVRDASARFQL